MLEKKRRKKMKVMSEALERLVEEVELELNDRNFKVKVTQVPKNNVIKLGILIARDNQDIQPIVYVDSLLEKIESGSISVNEAAGAVLHIRFNDAGVDLPYIRDTMGNITKEYVLAKVVRKLICKEKNIEFLEGLPHDEMLDLAIAYYIVNQEGNGITSSIVIKDKLMESLEITKEELEEAAIKNEVEKYGYEVQGMKDVIAGLSGEESVSDEDEDDIMYVASNKDKYFGATAILHKDVLDKIASKIKGDFYILPSSIHEVIATPIRNDNQEEVDELREMVTEINATQVEPEEVLTDNVYICRVPKDRSEDISIAIA